ncbi:SDR family NAD(P)-dependent oxidoreductase [Hominibacterium faecale]|uniref:SDR family NAD(P)-dependent oxidoreductase n=1 Tax=Hominibacterium faecale TaxID=2839743 RepID=UPI0022B2A992|nr:SDR family oxidoreductase [Hominibacterium faecale]
MKPYVLITGASSGVGRVLAKELAQDYNLVLAGRNKKALEQTAEECKSETLYWEQDLSNLENLEKNLTDLIRIQELSISKFVHCAGDMKMMPCKMFNAETFEKTFAVNVFSAALIVKVLTSRKINKKALNSAVFISSNISNRGAKTFGVYGSSKAALDGLMRNLAVELAPQVRVNSILPGAMRTKMTEKIFEDAAMQERMQQNYPMGIGTPEQLTGMVRLLLSDRAEWVTGQQFVIDGGRTIDVTD